MIKYFISYSLMWFWPANEMVWRVLYLFFFNFTYPQVKYHCSRSHTMTHSQSAGVIGPSQRPLPATTQNTRDKHHPCPWRDFFFKSSYFVFVLFSLRASLSWLFWLVPLPLLCNTNIHAFGGIRTRTSSKRAAKGLRLTRGHWDQHSQNTVESNYRHLDVKGT